MLKALTVRTPLKVALPLLISLLVVTSVTVVILLFNLRTDRVVFALAEQSLGHIHERIRDRLNDDLAAADRTGVEISQSDLSRFLENLKIGKAGIAFVVDEGGYLIAASRDARIPDPATGACRAARDSEDPLVAASASRLPARATRDLPSGGVVERFQADGRDVMLITTPFERSEHLRWTVATLVPVDDFLPEIRSGRRDAGLIAGGIVAVALALGVMLALYVARPITELTQHMRRIGHGKLDQAIFLEEFPGFMRISMAINQMVEDLRERLKLRESLAMATEVQQRLLPVTVPRFDGLDIAARSYHCDETGGDYYDYVRLGGLRPEAASRPRHRRRFRAWHRGCNGHGFGPRRIAQPLPRRPFAVRTAGTHEHPDRRGHRRRPFHDHAARGDRPCPGRTALGQRGTP